MKALFFISLFALGGFTNLRAEVNVGHIHWEYVCLIDSTCGGLDKGNNDIDRIASYVVYDIPSLGEERAKKELYFLSKEVERLEREGHLDLLFYGKLQAEIARLKK